MIKSKGGLRLNKKLYISHDQRFIPSSRIFSFPAACFLLGRMLFQGLSLIHLVCLFNFLEQINMKALGQFFRHKNMEGTRERSRLFTSVKLFKALSPCSSSSPCSATLFLSQIFFLFSLLSRSFLFSLFSLSLSTVFLNSLHQSIPRPQFNKKKLFTFQSPHL